MSNKPTVILSLATAIASLTGFGAARDNAKAALPHDTETTQTANSVRSTEQKATSLFAVGEELLGIVVTEQPDGTVVAQHSSHASHASHASHVSGS